MICIFVNQTNKVKRKNMKKIEKGMKLKAISICDSNCKWIAEVIERKGDFIIALLDGQLIRKKVKSFNNEEYVLLMGNYSMAPSFKPF